MAQLWWLLTEEESTEIHTFLVSELQMLKQIIAQKLFKPICTGSRSVLIVFFLSMSENSHTYMYLYFSFPSLFIVFYYSRSVPR